MQKHLKLISGSDLRGVAVDIGGGSDHRPQYRPGGGLSVCRLPCAKNAARKS